MPHGASTSHLFQPKLVATFLEGYDLGKFRKDLMAGVTVAVVALPLSMAIGVASGVSPERGLYAAIIGGFVVSALSGSRYQIGGPAGAFIPLVSACVAQNGLQGLLVAVLVSGLLLALAGALRIGQFIRLIPHPVTVGFTAGIAVTIFSSQIKDLIGAHTPGPDPSRVIEKTFYIASHATGISAVALLLSIACIVVIRVLRHLAPNFPSMLVAVGGAAIAVQFAHLPVETIASRFSHIPSGLPAPALPGISADLLVRLAPAIFGFTVLGGIESLLSAQVADTMSGRVHRSNMELVGQGIANVCTAFFGGVCVTGTIARTATNIRAGAVSPVAGMLHALFLLAFVLFAARLIEMVPLCALSAVLAGVCWDMIEKREIRALFAHPREFAVLAVTFLGVVIEDLTVGIIAGCAAHLVLRLVKRREG
jgi:SulP family sulfate permease